MDTYVKLNEDGQIKEWPVSDIHIRNRGHKERDYHKVRTKPLPKYNPRVEKCVERQPIIRNKVPVQNWVVKDLHISKMRKQLGVEIANYRYRVETSGIDVMGIGRVDTTRDEQQRISIVRSSIKMIPNTTVDWKSVNGWLSLNEVDFQRLDENVTRHIQGCFSAEKKVCDMVNSLVKKEEFVFFNVEKEFDEKLSYIKAGYSRK